jgi:hypothetical protein
MKGGYLKTERKEVRNRVLRIAEMGNGFSTNQEED